MYDYNLLNKNYTFIGHSLHFRKSGMENTENFIIIEEMNFNQANHMFSKLIIYNQKNSVDYLNLQIHE